MHYTTLASNQPKKNKLQKLKVAATVLSIQAPYVPVRVFTKICILMELLELGWFVIWIGWRVVHNKRYECVCNVMVGNER